MRLSTNPLLESFAEQIRKYKEEPEAYPKDKKLTWKEIYNHVITFADLVDKSEEAREFLQELQRQGKEFFEWYIALINLRQQNACIWTDIIQCARA